MSGFFLFLSFFILKYFIFIFYCHALILTEIYLLFKKKLLMFEYSCLHFPTTTFPFSTHPHLPPPIPSPFGFVHGSFIHVHLWPFPIFPRLFPSSLPFPLVTVSLLLISMSLVIFCVFVCFVNWVPLIGEIIQYLSFAAWLTSLSIMLSSSIYAVAKGRSSFFLSAA